MGLCGDPTVEARNLVESTQWKRSSYTRIQNLFLSGWHNQLHCSIYNLFGTTIHGSMSVMKLGLWISDAFCLPEAACQVETSTWTHDWKRRNPLRDHHSEGWGSNKGCFRCLERARFWLLTKKMTHRFLKSGRNSAVRCNTSCTTVFVDLWFTRYCQSCIIPWTASTT